jgi:hypothetical protein
MRALLVCGQIAVDVARRVCAARDSEQGRTGSSL